VEPVAAVDRRGPAGRDRVQFIIEPAEDGTVRLTHVEHVRGLLFPVFRALMGSAIQRHHEALNAALTRRAEQLAATSD
jgi:hypothetical protein